MNDINLAVIIQPFIMVKINFVCPSTQDYIILLIGKNWGMEESRYR